MEKYETSNKFNNVYYFVMNDGTILVNDVPTTKGAFESALSKEAFYESVANGKIIHVFEQKKTKRFKCDFWCNVFIITVALIACAGFIFL